MNTDRTTKLLLGVIAAALSANVLLQLMQPHPTRAAQSFSCSGKLDASSLGVEWPGGYDIKVDCR